MLWKGNILILKYKHTNKLKTKEWNKIYTWFSLFTVALFYNVSMNTELVNTELLLPAEICACISHRLKS